MKLSKQIATYKRLREQPLWRLLAADNAPIILALLQKHILDGEHRLPQSILHERIERDLEELRADGADLPQRSQIYVADWLSAGFLKRYFPAGATEEEYEISAAAAQAIRFIASVSEHRTSATESRLSAVIHQLTTLVEETDINPATRIASLIHERERIERAITNAEQGRIRVLDDAQALERVREIISLADDLIGDFRHVRDKFALLNRELREKLMDESDSRGEVLDALFAGVDLISDSEAGRTFAAFWRLLTDPEQNKTLEDALDVLPERPFCRHLRLEERQFLRRLIRILLDQGSFVHEVLQNFARSLKSFVQSREFLEQRRINQLLNEAQKAALALRDIVGVTEKLEFDLPLTSCRIRSLAQLALLDPSMGLSDTTISNAPSAEISLDLVSDLVAQSEIDFRTLKQNIRECLSYSHQVSIGELIDRFPAAQGLGSVIGYISLGSRHGLIVDKQSERVSWEGNDGIERAAKIPMIFLRGKYSMTLDEIENAVVDDSPSEEVETTGLFAGDTGGLPLDTRRALMQLLAGPFISGSKHSKLWSSLIRDEKIIQSRLSELFLDMVIDRDQQIAFVKQAEIHGIDAPTLLRRSQLTFIDSALILHLRRCLVQSDANGERAAISAVEILDHLSVYERAASTDRSGFVRRVNASIEKLKKNSILQLIRSTKDRYEISPTLKLLFSAAEIGGLTKLYEQVAASEAGQLGGRRKKTQLESEDENYDDE